MTFYLFILFIQRGGEKFRTGVRRSQSLNPPCNLVWTVSIVIAYLRGKLRRVRQINPRHASPSCIERSRIGDRRERKEAYHLLRPDCEQRRVFPLSFLTSSSTSHSSRWSLILSSSLKHRFYAPTNYLCSYPLPLLHRR